MEKKVLELKSDMMDAEMEKAKTFLPKDTDDDDHEWTEEEIVAACKELRRAVNAKHNRI